MESSHNDLLPLAWLLVLGLATFFVLVLLHELAHLLTAWAFGLEAVSFRVSRVELSAARQWRPRFVGGYLLGGSVSVRAPSLALTRPLLRYAVTIAAGPVMSIACFSLGLFLLSSTQGGDAATIPGLFCLLALYVFLTAIIPMRTGVRQTDGRVLAALMFSKGGRERCLARLQFMARFRAFRSSFEAGQISEAAEHLRWMNLAVAGRSTPRIRALMDHLQYHIESRESLSSCGWKLDDWEGKQSS